jgi:propionyl-CoA carboxylase beta chain
MDLCSTFHLPVVHFVDCAGFAVGVKHETAGVTRKGVRAMAAVYQATVPVCAVVIRKAFGLAGSAMMNPTKAKWRYCWPSGNWGSLPMAGGIEAAFRKELAETDDKETLLKSLYKKFEAMEDPFRTAEAFFAEEIIDPRETRPLLVDFVHHVRRRMEPGKTSFGPRP